MNEEHPSFVPLGDILRTHYLDFDEWLVKDLIPLGGITIISGSPASFKSYICQHLSLSVQSQKPFLGRFEVPFLRQVLYFDKEGRPSYIKKRFAALGAQGEPLIKIHREDGFYLDDDEAVDELVALLDSDEYILTGLIIFDSLIRYHKGNENTSQDMSAVFRNAKRLCNSKARPAVVIIQHSRKEAQGTASANSIRGSGDILAAADAQYSLAQDRGQGLITFTNYKMREAAELDPFAVRVIRADGDPKGEPIGFEHAGEYDKDKVAMDELRESITALFEDEQGELSRKDLYERLGEEYPKGLVNKAVESLCGSYLEVRKAERGKRLYQRTTSPDIVENPVG